MDFFRKFLQVSSLRAKVGVLVAIDVEEDIGVAQIPVENHENIDHTRHIEVNFGLRKS